MRHGTAPNPVFVRALVPVLVGAALVTVPPARGGEPGPQTADGPRPRARIAPMLLLGWPEVRADLGLSPSQTESARVALTELYAKAEVLRGQPDTPAVVAARRGIDQAQWDWIDRQLSAEQQIRLRQIDLQWEGPSALISRPSVAAALGLTAAQRKQVADAVAERNGLRDQGRCRPEDEQRLADRAMAILTEEQRVRWATLLGHPFVFQGPASPEPVTTAVAPTSGPK